jgi:tetratricopeptide (TPR) repeat protein
MAELPDTIHEQIQRLCAEGDDLFEQERDEEALARYYSAWELLPEPRTGWEAGSWILGAIADVHFYRDDFAAMIKPLMTAMQCDGATANPFLRLRLGQCLFELGEFDEAANWLAGAYLEEGKSIFDEDDPKYLAFIKSKLSLPPGGWPEGW